MRVSKPLSEPAAQHAHKLKAELPAQRPDLGVVSIDELATELRVLPSCKVADGPHTSPGVVTRIQQRDRGSGPSKFVGGGQACQPCSRNDDAEILHASSRQQWECHL